MSSGFILTHDTFENQYVISHAHFHREARGTIAFIAHQYGKWWEIPVRCPGEFVDYLNKTLPKAREQGANLYFTPNRFRGRRRRTAELVIIRAIYIDLDLHKASNPIAKNISEKIQAGIPQAALEVLEYVDIPAPTVVVASGRGAYLLYLLDPAPRATAQPLANAVAKALVAKLRNWGADAKVSTDMKRVLRVPGSINQRSGQEVIAYLVGDEWNIRSLVGEMADYAEDAEEFWSWLNAKRKKQGKRPDIRPIRRNKAGAALLWRCRLEDIWKILELRWLHRPAEGWRDKCLFLIGVALSWLLPADRGVIEAEIKSYAQQILPHDWEKFMPYMKTLLDRVEEVAKNPEVELEWGKGRYKFKAETISEMLEVTEEEALQLPNFSVPPTGVSLKEWKSVKVAETLKELRNKTLRERHGWKIEKTSKAVEERMAKVLVALQEGPKTLRELMKLTGLKGRAVKNYIRKLREAGYNIVAYQETGSKGAEKWLYMYLPVAQDS